MSEKHPHSIRSFVKRQGRVTLGQKKALEELLQQYSVDIAAGVINYKSCFGRDADTVIEIGSGNGDAMIEMASRHPEINFIAIEVHPPGVGRLLVNITKLKLQNVRVIMHDAVEVLRNNIADRSLNKIMIYFPDPWHKKRHHKRRLIQSDFAKVLRDKLISGGQLHLATDSEEYALQMLNVCSHTDGLRNISVNEGFLERPDFRPLTKFEVRGQRLGNRVWDLIFESVDA